MKQVIIAELERLCARLRAGETRDLYGDVLALAVLVLAMAKGDEP